MANKMNPTEDYRNKFPPLIVNDNITVDFKWHLWAAEVDLLSIGINGEKSIVTETEIAEYLQGVLDSVILTNISRADMREQAIIAQQQDGRSPGWIARYLKGWDTVTTVMENRE